MAVDLDANGSAAILAPSINRITLPFGGAFNRHAGCAPQAVLAGAMFEPPGENSSSGRPLRAEPIPALRKNTHRMGKSLV